MAALVLLSAGGASAQQRQTTPPATPQVACTALAGDHGDIVDAPAHVVSTSFVDVSADLPAYCGAQGYVVPNVGFEMRFPAKDWNGKFFMVGCGGFCGQIFIGQCDDPLRRGYACIATDMGHKSTPVDAKWAYNNLQAEVDWGSRSTHVTAVVGKGLIRSYYGRDPTRSYFMGGSTGGRMALFEAQHFPWDFDGIVGGVPPIEEMGDSFTLAWNALTLLRPNGDPMLSEADVAMVHQAVLDRCDMDDGVKDGIVSDPLACQFDPGEVACKGAKTASCLMPDQVAAVRKIYQGPVNSKGEHIYVSGALKGSEMAWFESYVRTKDHDHYYGMQQELLRYMAFSPDLGPSWNLNQIDWDKDYKRVGMMESLYAADNPDLRKFKAAGGKFILWQGWADQAVMPEKTIDYYQMAEKAMGGHDQMAGFFRLFMLPGTHHGGPYVGASTVDFIAAIEDWVEHAKAPDKIVGVHLKTVPSGMSTKYPLDTSAIAFSRPLFPYPMMAKYKGSGDTNDAANFEAVPLKGH